MYSNIIATGSNILWVGGNMFAGNEGAIKQLDIGGLIVTIKRLMSDTEYNTLGSYFMVHFVYRFNTLGGKSPNRRGPGGGPRGGHGFGGGGRPMRF